VAPSEGGTEDSGESRKQLPLFSTTELERDAEGRWPKRWVMDDRGHTVCSLCRQARTPEGDDPCIARLPGVLFACCGHGHEGAYVVIAGRGTLIGAAACAEMPRLGGNPPP
jgi:hypothetical protein